AHLRFRRYLHHRYLPPFPTRRSSDLDPDVAGGQPVHPVAGLPVGRGGAAAGECADAVTRQLREEVRQVGARGVPVQSEAALGEVDVPAVPGVDPFEVGASAAGADEDEGGGFGVTAEGRHAGFPAGGDEVPAPALLVDVPVEPAVVDAADLADVFEESAHI